MLPIANLNIRNVYDNAAEFFSLHSPTWSLAAQASDSSVASSPSTTRSAVPDSSPRECAPLRERLDAACHSPTSSLAGLSPFSMRRELDVTKRELAKSQAEVSRLEERCKMLEKTLKETRDMLRARDAELERMRRDKEKERMLAERRRSDVGPQYQPLVPSRDLHSRHSSLDMRSINGHMNGRSTPTDHHERALFLAGSEEERARIRSTEVYMTRTDSWSGAQVLQAVHDINSEILQFAASATEICTFDRDSRPSSSRSVQAMHDTSSRLGQNLARVLSNRDHSQDPILVQLALQGCVSVCITRALTSFCMGFPSKSDTMLFQIYSRIALAEPQPTSSKWRALAHRHLHNIHPQLADHAINDLCDTILRWSADIFIIAGCLSYENGATSSKDGLRLRFGEQVRRIAKAVTRLARVTREEIMSTCFDVIAVNQNDVFDSNGMSDAFGDYVASHGAILATTELGLRCTTRLRGSEPLEEHDDVTLEQRMILQPKVVLESVLDVLDPR
ncbi:hypothetical protein D9615_010104 [Tricholomella constricta]|uniref:Uncharacterized protein n=1 Tax=Tricholomella constricta TaxID=117010 RepID=A0A8H5GX84_9AGAR|nr:hypothetical protein D9615_010104 [Tricholomella constricta]